MMPPICAICYRDFRHSSDEGGLLTFKLTDAQKEFNKRFQQPGFVGHKKGDYWFCGEHYAEAKKITHLSLNISYKWHKIGIFIIYFNCLVQHCYGYSLYMNGFMKKMASYLE